MAPLRGRRRSAILRHDGGRPMGHGTVGVIANPMAGRDVRRIVAQASVFPNAEKARMVQRLLAGLGAAGVGQVLISTDGGGISAAVLRSLGPSGRRLTWPEVRFIELEELTGTAADTVALAKEMLAEGVDALVCLGGDGTARVTAAACGDTPLLALSTGTNNAYPRVREATVAGLAVGLVASGALPVADATTRDPWLEVRTPHADERALVDVCRTTSGMQGSRALWQPERLRELCCTFAEPDAIGLSSIPGLLCPSPRGAKAGVLVHLVPAETAGLVVRAPIAPGLVLDVGVASWRPLAPGEPVALEPGGTLALDGEREIELAPDERATVTFSTDGPVRIDPGLALSAAAEHGLLRRAAVALGGAEPRHDDISPSTDHPSEQARCMR